MSNGVNLGHGVCKKETEKAILVRLDDEETDRWIPKSQLHEDSEVFNELNHSDGDVVVKLWFAEKEGLV